MSEAHAAVGRSARPVVMIGHFPPPVHGMGVAYEALADQFAAVGRVARHNTAPGSLDSSLGYHARRVARVARAIGALAWRRRTSDTVVFAADAGLGMWYLIALLAGARALRYRCVVQHHSYAYITRRSRLMALAVRVGGPCLHVCSCVVMTRALRAQYPRIRQTHTVPMAYALPADSAGGSRALDPSGHITLGHFGNLTMAKGLSEAVGVFTALANSGVDVRLILAGPAMGDAERALISRTASLWPGRVDHRGPVFGPDRQAFFADIDVFLFPSRYRHESFGLVVWEGLLVGVPAIAYEAGCLTQALAGSGAVVLDLHEDFADRGAQIVRGWLDDPDAYAKVSSAACEETAAAVELGRRRVRELMGELTGGVSR